MLLILFFFSSRRRHTRCYRDWSSDVCSSDLVVASLGPGKPRDVLASLLNGSKFNYVILGEANNPGSVQKVILMAKASSATDATGGMTTAQNNVRLPAPAQAVEPPD